MVLLHDRCLPLTFSLRSVLVRTPFRPQKKARWLQSYWQATGGARAKIVQHHHRSITGISQLPMKSKLTDSKCTISQETQENTGFQQGQIPLQKRDNRARNAAIVLV
jgi:hypothetical protein